MIAYLEQKLITLSSPITLLNGPSKQGDPTAIAHAYLSSPISASYLVPIAGRLRIGRRWTYKGKRYSYVNARCETGKLQAEGEFTFTEGIRLDAIFIKPCKAKDR